MTLLHGNTAASVADKFHGCQLVFANMLRVDLRGAAEAAFFLIVARITEVTGCLGHRATIFTGIGHVHSPSNGVWVV
jgi:hypothetical protein